MTHDERHTLPGLFDYITDALPISARIIQDPVYGRYKVYIAKTGPGGAAVNQGRLDLVKKTLSYNAAAYAHEPILTISRQEMRALYEAFGKELGLNTDITKVTSELKTAQKERDEHKAARERAEKLHDQLKDQASKHKNNARNLQVRLDATHEFCANLLDRLTK